MEEAREVELSESGVRKLPQERLAAVAPVGQEEIALPSGLRHTLVFSDEARAVDIRTADLCDQFSDELDICEPLFGDFGGQVQFGARSPPSSASKTTLWSAS